MKLKSLFLSILCLAAIPAFAHDAPKDSVKLTYLQERDLVDALSKLDGTPLLDAENHAVTETLQDGSKHALTRPYEFTGPTRIAISVDITAITASLQVYMDTWKKYLKSANVVDESKETDVQKADIAAILTAPMEVKITFFDEAELKTNPVPSTLISRLQPLLK